MDVECCVCVSVAFLCCSIVFYFPMDILSELIFMMMIMYRAVQLLLFCVSFYCFDYRDFSSGAEISRTVVKLLSCS